MSERLATQEAIQPITIGQVLAFFRSCRRTVLRSVLVAVVFGFVWIAIAHRQYEAIAVYAPVSTGGMSSMQDPALRSLVSLAGPAAGGFDRTSPFTKFKTVLTSVRVAERLNAQHPEILQTLMQGNWDAEHKQWIPPRGPLVAVRNLIGSVLGLSRWQPPGADTLAQYLQMNLSITSDDVTGLLTVRYKSGDPVFAANVVAWTCQVADDLLRRSARARTNGRIDYLKKVLPDVTVAAQRDTLISLLSQQEQSSMIIEADPTYAAELLIPPSISRTPVWPKPSLMLIMSVALGTVAGLLFHAFGAPLTAARRKAFPAAINALLDRLC